MTGAYSTFVNKGIFTKPYFITRIEDKHGNIIQEFPPRPRREVLSEETAYLMVYMLMGGTEEEGGTSRGLSLEVKEGDVLGIIGKNGAGKSTLLKILSRVTAPSTGSIKVNGRLASLLEVGTGFHPELTGRENIFLNGAILGMNKAEIRSKLDEIIDFSGCERYIDTPVKRYSSGMNVRLGFAVAAFLEPEILVVDEVLAVGDAEFQKKAIGKMKDVSTNQGRTVLFVSHNMNSIKKLCTKGIILKDGQLNYQGTIDNTISEYLKVFTSNRKAQWINDSTSLINEYLSPQKLQILDLNNRIINRNINKNEQLWIHFDFEINEIKKDLTLCFSIFDQNDNHLFRSLHTDFNDNINNYLLKGTNTLRCILPADLLNEGEYRIVLDGGIYKNSWDLDPFNNNTPSINITIEGGFTHSDYWQNKRAGLLAPNIMWNLNNKQS